MKVTRPPGRDPARNAVSNTSMKRAQGERLQRADDRRSTVLVMSSASEMQWDLAVRG